MPDKSLIITRRITRNSDQISGLFHVPYDSPWFIGHFPSYPILPAIALIELVARILNEGEGKEQRVLCIRRLKRVRFRQIVNPGEDIHVDLIPEKKTGQGQYRFKISSPDKPGKAVADGFVLTADPEAASVRDFPLPVEGGEKLPHNIEKYLPHRDRVKLVDGIMAQEGPDEQRVTASVKETWPLFQTDQGVNPIVIIELVAQATAVMMGLEVEDSDKGYKDSMNLGYIVGIKKANLANQFIQVGSELIIKTKKERWKENYGVFQGFVYDTRHCYGAVHVQVFRPDQHQKL